MDASPRSGSCFRKSMNLGSKELTQEVQKRMRILAAFINSSIHQQSENDRCLTSKPWSYNISCTISSFCLCNSFSS
ncbi:hypothetical protein LINPERPRIM_LOCUS13714 [Linum perenne]